MCPSCTRPVLPGPRACTQGSPAAVAATGVKSLAELPAYPGDFVRRRLITFVGIVLVSCFSETAGLSYADPKLQPKFTAKG